MMRECTYDPERSEVNQVCWVYPKNFRIQFVFYTEFDAFEISLANAPDYSVPSYPKKNGYEGTLIFKAIDDRCNYLFLKSVNNILFFKVIVFKN